jgi:CRISPR-associated protein Csb2
MSFAIVAEYPLGFYRGRVGEGQLDIWPSLARLHAAFTSAAGSGLRAAKAPNGALRPSAADNVALEWLEENPPDGLALPQRQDSRPDARAYRDLGLVKKRGKRAPKADASAVAVGGRLMWVWETEPPPDVVAALGALCPDVPYLGQSDSPVRLWTQSGARTKPTHRRDSNPRLSTARGSDVELEAPRPGRTKALVRSYAGRVTAKAPTLAKDRVKTDERELPPPGVAAGLGRERFVADEPAASGPWPTCWVVPFIDHDNPGAQVALSAKVAFAVALHRALISRFDGDAPSVLTGQYAEGVRRPSSRIALHVVSRGEHPGTGFPPDTTGGGQTKGVANQAFVIACPAKADPADLVKVARALSLVRYVAAKGHRLDLLHSESGLPAVDGGRFWSPATPGQARVWSVLPAVVETRAQGKSWTLTDAVMLSVGLVWRDELVDESWWPLASTARYRALVARVKERGVEVVGARPLRETHVERYLHRVPDGLMPLPYTATVALGSLETAGTSFMAIGQSRHLGGGLLMPCDIPADVLESWRQR